MRTGGVHIVAPARYASLRSDLGQEVTSDLEVTAADLGRQVQTEVREAEDIETGVLEAVNDLGADLLILGTSVRAGTTSLHLGPRVEHMTRQARCPVVILNT
jgi:nucleotide-binding universal stress UspA family protein